MLSSQNRLQSSPELNERCLPGNALSLYSAHEIHRAAEIFEWPGKSASWLLARREKNREFRRSKRNEASRHERANSGRATWARELKPPIGALSIRSKILTTFATSWNPREHRKLSSRPIFADSPNGPKTKPVHRQSICYWSPDGRLSSCLIFRARTRSVKGFGISSIPGSNRP